VLPSSSTRACRLASGSGPRTDRSDSSRKKQNGSCKPASMPRSLDGPMAVGISFLRCKPCFVVSDNVDVIWTLPPRSNALIPPSTNTDRRQLLPSTSS
jgi:hypothetical protein